MAARMRLVVVLGFAGGILVPIQALPAQYSAEKVVAAPSAGQPQPATISVEASSPGAAASRTIKLAPGQMPPGFRGQPVPPGKPGGTKKETPGQTKGKPDDKKAKDKDKKKDGKEDESPKTVQRPETPPKPPDPEELKVKPDKDGKVRFNFHGQPWPKVLQWLADISGMNLDWQEVPGGYLNLTTQRSYSLPEARDMINRHLLARGFTLLQNGELMSVVSFKKLDPAMVPRVSPDELSQRDPHEVVKVSFPLDWLLAKTAVEDLKPMLSPNHKLTALEAMNRLEAIDAVVNLREVHAVLLEAQSAGAEEQLVRTFPLRYARAPEVLQQLRGILGLQPQMGGSSGSSAKAKQQAMQMAAMMKAQQQKGKKSAAPPKPKVEVNLVADERNNVILACAPPDKMAIIEQTVKTLDVPRGLGQSPLATMKRMQIYRLAAIDPEPLVKTLEEIGNLDFDTRLEVDRTNRAIIAYASLVDHVTIRTLVDKLDGGGRTFHVIQLRRLGADYVAGTIEFMMGAGEEEQSSRRSYYPYYSRGRSQSDQGPKKFRVDADVENNKLLLWANEFEFQAIEDLLVKLGEIPAEGGDPRTVRVMDVSGSEETEAFLERIRRAWPSIGLNPLSIESIDEPQPKPPEPSSKEESTKPPSADKETATEVPAAGSLEKRSSVSPSADKQAGGRDAAGRPGASSLFRFAQLRVEGAKPAASPAAEDAPAKPSAKAADPSPQAPRQQPAGDGRPPADPAKLPPIRITRQADGRLVISSQDTQALDRLEELMARLAPARSDYKVFHLKYASAYWVAMNLEDFFKEEEKDEGRRFDSLIFGFYDRGGGGDEKSRARLSKRRPLRFISDTDSSTILVQGADAAQLKTIDELIQVYDQPARTDSESAHQQEIFQIRHSKATVVADAIKDVYRDLLSSNDKALANNRNQRTERRYVLYGGGGMDDAEQKTPRFKGLLSIGVDELSNTLIVSAPSYLLENIRTMVKELDKAAEPVSAVRVIETGAGVNATLLQEKLLKILGQQSAGRKTSKKPAPKKPQGPTPGGPGRSGTAASVTSGSR